MTDYLLPNTAFGGIPYRDNEDDMTLADLQARQTQYQIGKLLGKDDEDCCPAYGSGSYGQLNCDYDEETHDAYNRLIDADPLYAAKLSEDLATLAIATHHERLDKAATSNTGPTIPRTRKGAPTSPS